MVRPDIQVTLSESQLKKSAFLREAARVLELSNCKVHAGRTETLPSLAVFEAVVMRAVDDSGESHVKALSRVAPGGRLLTLEKAEREHEEFLFEAPVPYSIGVLRVYQP
jgi:16S rRNA G527 N7-methylase RsmG